MFPARTRWSMLLAALCALCSCTAVPLAQRDQPIARDLALPTAVAAALVAEAVRATLPLADPLPYAGGAPATVIGPDDYRVRYERRGGQWLPAAEHRLRCEGARVVVRPAGDLRGYGLGADRVLQLEIRTTATGAAVTGAVPAHRLPEFEAALARGLQAHASAAAPLVEFARALEFAHAGELDRARHHRDHAVLSTADPALRAAVQRPLAVEDSGAQARSHARERLADRDLKTARVLLHTARRSAPEPGLDYRLLWQLHRASHDQTAALASALLAREYDPLATTLAVAELERSGLAELVERVTQASLALLSPGEVFVRPAAAPAR